MAQIITFAAQGATLSGSLFWPEGPARAAVVIHAATGVPQGFYRGFAEWLSAREQAVVLTYDYRDFGASATGPLRQSRATMADWGLHDQAAAQQAVEAACPDVPVWVVGHSLGGLMLSFQPGAARVARLIAVASGPNHVSHHPLWYRPLAWSFWHGHGAAAARMMGYLPGRRIGLGSDLPLGVFHQWRRWCNSPGFFRSDIGRHLPQPDWTAFTGKLRLVALADDVMIPPATVAQLADFYPAARLTHRVTLVPRDHGLRGVGHIGAFARRNAALWPHLIG